MLKTRIGIFEALDIRRPMPSASLSSAIVNSNLAGVAGQSPQQGTPDTASTIRTTNLFADTRTLEGSDDDHPIVPEGGVITQREWEYVLTIVYREYVDIR